MHGSVIDGLLAGLKSRRKCPNIGLQESVIDGLLAALKSRRKCASFSPQGSVIDGRLPTVIVIVSTPYLETLLSILLIITFQN